MLYLQPFECLSFDSNLFWIRLRVICVLLFLCVFQYTLIFYSGKNDFFQLIIEGKIRNISIWWLKLFIYSLTDLFYFHLIDWKLTVYKLVSVICGITWYFKLKKNITICLPITFSRLTRWIKIKELWCGDRLYLKERL